MKRLSSFARFLPLLMIGGMCHQLQAQPSNGKADKRFFDFTIGLGIDLHSAPSIVDYINLVAQPRLDQKLDEFSTAVEFYAVPELQVSSEWSTAVEYSFLVKSHSIDNRSGFSRSELSYQVHMPTVLVHYLVFGEGYRLKLGGGVGYHLARFDQSFPTIGSEETLRSEGIGFKLDVVGNTKFDETFYGSIGIDLRWDFVGTLTRSGDTAPVERSTPSLPKMNFFNVGVKLGVTFQFY